MTDPIITDEEVEAFYARVSTNGFDTKEALSAFLKARVPSCGDEYQTEYSAGFDACIDRVLMGDKT